MTYILQQLQWAHILKFKLNDPNSDTYDIYLYFIAAEVNPSFYLW
jgi:hypothetical protein